MGWKPSPWTIKFYGSAVNRRTNFVSSGAPGSITMRRVRCLPGINRMFCGKSIVVAIPAFTFRDFHCGWIRQGHKEIFYSYQLVSGQVRKMEKRRKIEAINLNERRRLQLMNTLYCLCVLHELTDTESLLLSLFRRFILPTRLRLPFWIYKAMRF